MTILWRDVVAVATPAMQNQSKRDAIRRTLLAHPDWSDRRVARSIKILILTEDDLNLPVFEEQQ